MDEIKIYLAGPLFTSAECTWNKNLANLLEQQGFLVWLPQENEPREKTASNIFWEDVRGIDWAGVVVANMDGTDPDSGTCWECGYAFAKGKLILSYRTDFRGCGEDRDVPYNIMLAESAFERWELPKASVEKIAETISEYFNPTIIA